MNDDEHVVDTDAEEEERNGRMNGSVKDAQIETQAIGRQDGHAHYRHAHHWKYQLTPPVAIGKKTVKIIIMNDLSI